jgi:hypothetical protein
VTLIDRCSFDFAAINGHALLALGGGFQVSGVLYVVAHFDHRLGG